ncbi:Arginine repressor [Slackia heliotrinireducens]|uniref:Arginine repressor n=1 Tax=Slackia heliotrinireducens (strain ATCC 29202 / DSM 20476 / NCTC 11029 / RHS 1) TaxID=471855 RepID=C7N313_SLAHD|nr:ArgR family transcriptional regulator [Slackia heliotrinireducens]ACV21534.1 arginine repressor [Slackia heliotrinireducens DSM 20476]VEG99009.1 Arginine repressor [Slackia heliotrinireducens]
MTKRVVRHDVIREIIRRGNYKTQRDLAEQLRLEGYDCTQATVSRDIKVMGVAKSRDGYYVLPEDMQLKRMVGELVESVEAVDNWLVIKTPSGIASGVTVALDDAQLQGVVGTIAGDNTIFVMTRSTLDAEHIADIIRKLQNNRD